MILLLVFAGFALVPAALVVAFRRRWPVWSGRRAIMLAALPAPAAVLLLGSWMFVKTTLPAEGQCTGDSCGMAIGVPVMLSVAAVGGFGVGCLSAWLSRRIAAR